MDMKTNRWLSLALVTMAVSLGTVEFMGCSSDQPAAKNEKATKYTCPMHPEVVQDKAGDCPKCGMKLVEKK